MSGAAGARPAKVGTLAARTLGELVAELADGGRVPGIGSVSAVVTAMAAAVVTMAARASVDDWADAPGVAAQAEALRRRALPLADADAAALAEALGLLERRSGEPGRPEQRDFRLGVVLAAAADVPLAIAEVASDVAALAAEVGERAHAQVRPDAVGAAVMASGAARAAAHLVDVNLATTAGDARVLAARALARAAFSSAERALAVHD